MAWGWSHTQEAYDAAEYNLRHMDKDKLEVIYAEWRAAQDRRGNVADPDAWNQRKYDKALAYAKTLDEQQLADFIWEKASEYATCDNGGYNAWMCPTGCGCHTVDFDWPEGVTADDIEYEREFGR